LWLFFMLLFSSILGIFLSVILLYFNARNNKSTIYLGGFFFLVSLYELTQYVLFSSNSNFLVAVFFINIGFLAYLIGPMLYWYSRSVLTDNPSLKRRDLWHFLPMIIFFIASLPHILTPWSEKIEIAVQLINDPAFITKFKGNILYGIFPVYLIYLSRPILILCYIFWSALLFMKYTLRRREMVVLSRQLFMTKWLYILLGSMFILTISHTLLMIETYTNRNMNVFFTLNILQIMSLAGLLGLLISPFFFPTILYGLPRLPEPIFETKSKELEVNLIQIESIKQTLHFENDYLISIGQKTDSCLKEFKPYLQPEFNMAQLSVYTQIPVHHLSFYFREEKKQHFNEYRNEWRVNHAKVLIKEGKANEITLEAIGLLSGFSTRNTFFKSFKKVEGISPGVFADQFTD